MYKFSFISVFCVVLVISIVPCDGIRLSMTSHARKSRFAMISKPTEILNQQIVSRTDSSSSVIFSSINLLKNCLGAGVFSLSSRVLSQTTHLDIYPVSALVILMSLWATYCFNLLGITCNLTGSKTYGEAWTKTISKDTYWIVQSILVIAPIVSCLANVIVLSDIMAFVMRTLNFSPLIFGNRNIVITILGCTILYPLCIQRDLSKLKAVSLIGILGHLIAMAAFAIRLHDNSYGIGGVFEISSAIVPSAMIVCQGSTGVDLSSWFVLASLLSYCFVTHYNAPRYYSELNGSDSRSKPFLKMALISYLSAALIYLGTIILPLKLFGANCASFALNSFSPKDPIATVARVAFGTSVLASFPLIFLSMRNFFVVTFFGDPPEEGLKRISTLLLIVICSLATQFRDIGFVGSLAGGILGSSMMFIFPPMMYLSALRQYKFLTPLKLVINVFLIALGAGLGLIGTFNNLRPYLVPYLG